MTIEAINNILDSLGTNTAVLVPSDTSCYAFTFVNKSHAAESINKLSEFWTNKGLDTEYSFTSIGNVEVWDYELLKHCVKECYRVDAVNDYILKFYQAMCNEKWASD